MKQTMFKILAVFFVFGFWNQNVLQSQDGTLILDVDASNTIAEIQPTMYGIFFEDINFAADGGIYAEMVKNRSFEFTLPKMGWAEPNSNRFSKNEKSGIGAVIKNAKNAVHNNHLRIKINDAEGYELINEGFRGMGVKAGELYDVSVNASLQSGDVSAIHFQFINDENVVLAETTLPVNDSVWTTYEGEMKATATEAKAKLKISFTGNGLIDLDMISVFPQDTWKGRKKGLRKDLVQILDDLKPGFLRFPGGCIVEGRTLARRYQWQKTVGDIEERELLVNRWNTEFSHRSTPDYYQSFGLGFYEYFQLSEDLGAEPMPILGCGMACQFNTGELVPMDELGPYVQEALELIEFANGNVGTKWGKLRSDMGHPEPFNMKYLGIGNEQWGEEYIKRYKVFEKAIKEKHPEIVIISGSGPFPDGEMFEYGMAELTKLNAEIVDEHYYRPTEWFKENATRYDTYDRNGPKIFAGEYAAQSVAIASPKNKNNWNCALSEAAFMTGLERNADLVVMTSYAPLMAHEDGWQWTPDLIWFNNLESYGTANYYVQKMYSNHAGTDLLKITRNGAPVTGQDNLYATATKEANTNELILKIVNTSGVQKNISINIKGENTTGEAMVLTMATDDLEAENSFQNPEKIIPIESKIKVQKGILATTIPSNAFVIYRVKLN